MFYRGAGSNALSSRPGDANRRQKTGSSLVQLIVCRVFDCPATTLTIAPLNSIPIFSWMSVIDRLNVNIYHYGNELYMINLLNCLVHATLMPLKALCRWPYMLRTGLRKIMLVQLTPISTFTMTYWSGSCELYCLGFEMDICSTILKVSSMYTNGNNHGITYRLSAFNP